MGRILWLPDVLRKAGVDVAVLPGAETRGRETYTVKGVVWHHTVTGPAVSNERVAALLRDGRSDLAGPLCQVGIERDGTWVIIALGRANHNGYATRPDPPWKNDSLGLEFYNDGKGEPYPNAQIQSGIVGTAAVLRHLGLNAFAHVLGHKESDPGRKIDPLFDMRPIRASINHHLGAPPAPTPKPQEGEVKDGIIFFAVPGGNHAYRCAGYDGIYLDKATLDALRFVGIPLLNDPAKPWPANVQKGYRLHDGPLANV